MENKTPPTKKKFRILTIDGGGLRGICPILVLKEIERRTGKRIFELFDMFAGTSTGSLIAMGVLIPSDNDPCEPKYSMEDIEEVYSLRGNEIFPQRNGLVRFFHKVKSFFRPEFDATGLTKVLNELLGDCRMNDCLKPIFITAYDLRNNSPLFFKARHALRQDDANAKLYDVARATSAGPTYLPAHAFSFKGKDILCVDGGIFMNNPTLGALVEFSRYKDKEPYNAPGLGFEDIHVLSLSTGSYAGSISKKNAMKWGKIQWISPLIDTMMRGVNQTTDYMVREILSYDNKVEQGKDHISNYMRVHLNIDDPKHSEMTNSSKETRDYLTKVVNDQVIDNAEVSKRLDDFLKEAGIPVLDNV